MRPFGPINSGYEQYYYPYGLNKEQEEDKEIDNSQMEESNNMGKNATISQMEQVSFITDKDKEKSETNKQRRPVPFNGFQTWVVVFAVFLFILLIYDN